MYMSKRGRPTIYSKALVDTICERLSQGMSLRTICLAKDMPEGATIFRWLASKPDFCEQYDKAKEASAAADNETLEDLGDLAIKLSQEVGDKRANAVVQAVKLKADNLKWAMSKKKPKKYGDKIDMTSGGDKIGGVEISIRK